MCIEPMVRHTLHAELQLLPRYSRQHLRAPCSQAPRYVEERMKTHPAYQLINQYQQEAQLWNLAQSHKKPNLA